MHWEKIRSTESRISDPVHNVHPEVNLLGPEFHFAHRYTIATCHRTTIFCLHSYREPRSHDQRVQISASRTFRAQAQHVVNDSLDSLPQRTSFIRTYLKSSHRQPQSSLDQNANPPIKLR
ncbi:hypothetical protein AC578_9859 [Pseudocercospora eumusae]|uniref:Uncharacterized protein n=1 Tax=Pseudocercospora eumusae TaxID=321146 RepID=A0A139HB01_9PEZI|nr:hypothetical protein AC578_9859 [Pseudocercospora eumusae]